MTYSQPYDLIGTPLKKDLIFRPRRKYVRDKPTRPSHLKLRRFWPRNPILGISYRLPQKLARQT